MAKTRQVLKMTEGGKTFSVVFREDAKYNPYVLYRHTWGLRECGYGCSEHKRIEAKYADMRSVLYHLAQII